MYLNRLLFTFLLGLILTLTTLAQEPAWLTKMNKVKLLSETYEEIIKRFGTPSDKTTEPNRGETYKFDEGILQVWFTMDRCERSPGDPDQRGWDVPQYRAEQMHFFVEEKANLTLESYKLDVAGFAVSNKYYGKWTSYYNSEIGKAYILDEKGILREIWFYPTVKQNTSLRCQ